jgi:hypothetical protein
MAVSSRTSRVAASLTTEERQKRLQEEIRNLRSSMPYLMSHQRLGFSVMIELRELELASLEKRPPKAAQEIADARPDAA